MPSIGPLNEMFFVIAGEHRGKICLVPDRNFSRTHALVAFLDGAGEVVQMEKSFLHKLDTPGLEAKFGEPYTLTEYLELHKEDNSNLLRMAEVAQPRTLKLADMLATGEIVTKPIRKGYNDIILACFGRFGWVEINPMLPIAMHGNEKFYLPMEITSDTQLITGLVINRSYTSEIGKVTLIFDQEKQALVTPAFIPLAFA